MEASRALSRATTSEMWPARISWAAAALGYGTTQASNPWVLGMDADTEAAPGCAAAVLHAALREGFDVVIATAEFALIDGKTEATYLSASRLGMTAIGGRAVRKNVFATYNNAKNHASFAQ